MLFLLPNSILARKNLCDVVFGQFFGIFQNGRRFSVKSVFLQVFKGITRNPYIIATQNRIKTFTVSIQCSLHTCFDYRKIQNGRQIQDGHRFSAKWPPNPRWPPFFSKIGVLTSMQVHNLESYIVSTRNGTQTCTAAIQCCLDTFFQNDQIQDGRHFTKNR